MMAGIYCADIYCDDCIEDIKRRVAKDYWNNPKLPVTPDGYMVVNFKGFDDLKDHLDGMDERHYDSDQYPKNADDDNESDCPQHCGSGADCLNYSETSDGEKYGYFFENTLTDDGDEYVKETVNENLRDGRMDSPVVELWKPCYDYIEYHDKCECGTYGDLDEDDKCEDCSEVFLVCNGCGDDFPCDDVNDDNYCKDCADAIRPQDGDYTITPCGALGGMSGVGIIEGKFVGEFHSDDEAIMAIRRLMNEEKSWPNIWTVSDHGNWMLYKD